MTTTSNDNLLKPASERNLNTMISPRNTKSSQNSKNSSSSKINLPSFFQSSSSSNDNSNPNSNPKNSNPKNSNSNSNSNPNSNPKNSNPNSNNDYTNSIDNNLENSESSLEVKSEITTKEESRATKKLKNNSFKRFISPRGGYSLTGGRKKSKPQICDTTAASEDAADSTFDSDDDRKSERSFSRRSIKEEMKRLVKKSTYSDIDFDKDSSGRSDSDTNPNNPTDKKMKKRSHTDQTRFLYYSKSPDKDKDHLHHSNPHHSVQIDSRSSEYVSDRFTATEVEKEERSEFGTESEVMVNTHQPTTTTKTAAKSELGAGSEDSDSFENVIEETPYNLEQIGVLQKYIRKYHYTNELQLRIHFSVQRKHIFNEIVETEESYVRDLRDLVENIYEPVLQVQKTTDPILEPTLFKSLFPGGHITIIYNAHKDFISELREKRKDWTVQQTVGDIFLTMCGFLRLYTHYAETYTQTEDVLEHLRKEKKFMGFIKDKWPTLDPVVELSSLLIKPIQRIPRYQLLIESLFKNTWKSHDDYQKLRDAHEEIIKTVKHVNDKAKEAHNAKKLVLIDASLIGMKSKSLVAANRKFVREGFLTQRTEKGEWKKRYFFLFSDLLIRSRVNRKQKNTYIFIDKVTLTKLELTRTLNSDIKDLVTKDIRSRAFEINHPYPIRYILAAPTTAERNEWCDDIDKLLVEVKEAEAQHEEAVFKLSAQKAVQAKKAIAETLLQHTYVGGSYAGATGTINFRDRLQNVKSNNQQKSKTVDPSTIRAYAEHMAASRKPTGHTLKNLWADQPQQPPQSQQPQQSSLLSQLPQPQTQSLPQIITPQSPPGPAALNLAGGISLNERFMNGSNPAPAPQAATTTSSGENISISNMCEDIKSLTNEKIPD